MTPLDAFLLLIATILGAVTTSVLGWLDSNNPFNVRQFVPGLIRGIIASIIVFIAGYEGFVGEITLFTYLGAFLAGGGFDTIGNRLAGILNVAQPPKPATPPTPVMPPSNFRKITVKMHRFYVFHISK